MTKIELASLARLYEYVAELTLDGDFLSMAHWTDDDDIMKAEARAALVSLGYEPRPCGW